MIDVVSLQISHKIRRCTTFKGLEGQTKKGDMELERGFMSCIWAGGAWHGGGGSICEWKAGMVVVVVVVSSVNTLQGCLKAKFQIPLSAEACLLLTPRHLWN